MDSFERILLVKSEVFVYMIPPRTTSRGYRAADWNLQSPNWTGRLRVVNKDKDCILKLEDKISGELYAKCPIDKYPGVAIEAVLDSSRYFVIKVQDDNGRTAFIGIGFADRGDSFDLNVALQDHFKWIQKSEEIAAEEALPETKPQLDLGFKEGQTIKINMNIASKSTSRTKPKSSGLGGTGLLPPPPGGVKIAPPSSLSNKSTSTKDSDDLLGLCDSKNKTDSGSSSNWSDFTSASNNSDNQSKSSNNSSGGAWVQF